jgi:hypothetical protein
MCSNCSWQEFLEEIEELSADERYEFAAGTLREFISGSKNLNTPQTIRKKQLLISETVADERTVNL